MQELIERLDLEEFNYYYHVTGRGYGDEIINDGLYLEEPDLKSTTIKLTQDIIDNFEEYCASEYNDSLVKRQEMVIVGCLKGEEQFLIEKIDMPRITESQRLNYLIRSENILGYIDLETLEVVYNPECIHDFTI